MCQADELLYWWLLCLLAALGTRQTLPPYSLLGPPVRWEGQKMRARLQAQPDILGRSKTEQKQGTGLREMAPFKLLIIFPPLCVAQNSHSGLSA